jgi:uncharacterized integral membrane protein
MNLSKPCGCTHTHTHGYPLVEEKNNGITLIALIITIIVLLILARSSNFVIVRR